MKSRATVKKEKSNQVFARNLAKVLGERQVSQKSAAELAKVPSSTINDWLSGVMPSDPLAVQRLCKALKCDFEWLLTGTKGPADLRAIPLSEIFESHPDPDFSGVFEITARRLKRKNGDK